MNELWIMTFYYSESGIETYYENYQSLLFYQELDKVKFSLSDQYLCYYNSFNNIGYSIFLIEESKQKKSSF